LLEDKLFSSVMNRLNFTSGSQTPVLEPGTTYVFLRCADLLAHRRILCPPVFRYRIFFHGLACAEAEPLRKANEFLPQQTRAGALVYPKFKCPQSYFWVSVIRYLNLFRVSILEFRIYRYRVTLTFLLKSSKPFAIVAGFA